MTFKYLVNIVLRYNKKSNVGLLEKAYKYAQELNKGRIRKSGKKAIDHNLEVAQILAGEKVDDITLAASLMHNSLNLTKNKKEIEEKFGKVILSILEGMKKGAMPNTKEYTDKNAFRKLLLAGMKDVRILLIRLADKLSSLRDIKAIQNEKNKEDFAKECLNIFAPLAHKIGSSKIKKELEDLSFKQLNPEEYRDLGRRLNEKKEDREKRLYKVKKIIKKNIKSNILVEGRTKHIYSIYKKIKKRDYVLERMKDLVGVRLITDNIEDCYEVLSFIRNKWSIVQITDYIASPKPNGYQSIHLVIIDPELKMVEFQIRTKKMHEYAEEGVAAHALYKGIDYGRRFNKRLSWLKEILESLPKDGSFDTRSIDLFGDRIFILTPKGKVVELPEAATAIDFAYALHTTIGNTATGALINGKHSSLKSVLKNGDTVQILTQKNKGPSMDWLNEVITQKAKDKIRNYLRKKGKPVYGSIMKEKNIKLNAFIESDKYKSKDIFYCSSCEVMPGKEFILEHKPLGYLVAHKGGCNKAGKKKELVKGKWKDFKDKKIELVHFCKDRVGMISEILTAYSKENLNISQIKLDTKTSRATCHIVSKFPDINHLLKLLKRLKKLKDFKKIYLKKPSI